MPRVNPSRRRRATTGALPGLSAYAALAPHKKPAQAPAGHVGSRLEENFKFLWQQCGGGLLVREFMFHPVRKWRADFCHAETRTLIEIEGGIWNGGRHTTGQGFADDCEKYLEAALQGYRVIRLYDGQLKKETVERIVALTMF